MEYALHREQQGLGEKPTITLTITGTNHQHGYNRHWLGVVSVVNSVMTTVHIKSRDPNAGVLWLHGQDTVVKTLFTTVSHTRRAKCYPGTAEVIQTSMAFGLLHNFFV